MADERERPRVEVERPRCPFCHEGVEAEAEKAACTSCMAWHHEGCWGEGGGCAACGARAPAAPPRAKSRPVRRPVTARRANADAADQEGFQDSAPSAVLVHRAAAVQRRTRQVRLLLGVTTALVSLVAGGAVAWVMGESGVMALVVVALFFVIAGTACALAGGAAWLVVRGIERAAARAEEEAMGPREEATGPRATGGPGPG